MFAVQSMRLRPPPRQSPADSCRRWEVFCLVFQVWKIGHYIPYRAWVCHKRVPDCLPHLRNFATKKRLDLRGRRTSGSSSASSGRYLFKRNSRFFLN